MKRIGLLLIVISLLSRDLKSQSSFIFAGTSYLPNKIDSPASCFSCNILPSQTGFDFWKESFIHPGYSFYLGVGKKIKLNERWSLLGTWQLQHGTNLVDEKWWRIERNESKNRLAENDTKKRVQNTTWQISFLTERDISILNNNWRIHGGGYVGFEVEDWVNYNGTYTEYFTDIETDQVYDNACQCTQTLVVNKTEITPPNVIKTDGDHDAGGVRSFKYGIQGGISFPLLSPKEGRFRGQLIVAQDLNPYFNDRFKPKFYQTSIRAGLVYEPNRIQFPHARKPEKRTLSSGVHWGISWHDIAFISIDGGWLSSKNIGIDFSARYAFYFYESHKSVFIGPVIRLGNSHFILKAGGEYFWLPASEAPDEKSYSFYVGGKYIIPVSKFAGIQLSSGYYLHSKHAEVPVSFGIGFVFLPKMN